MSTDPVRLLRSGRREPTPPAHLSRAAKAIWRRIVADYELEEHHRAILGAALEARDRMYQARDAIDADGAYVEGRFGPKAHPAIAVERDSRLAMIRALRELGLDLEAPASPRPPSRWKGR